MAERSLREGWMYRDADPSFTEDDWEPIEGHHFEHDDAAESWAEHDAYPNWMWESKPDEQHEVLIRSPEGEVKRMSVRFEYEPTFHAHEVKNDA